MSPEAYFDEVKKLGLKLEEIPRTVIDRVVWVLGEKFDAVDLYECLMELEDSASSIHLTDYRMVKMLQNIGIINGTSASWGTSIASQERLKEFIKMVRTALYGEE